MTSQSDAQEGSQERRSAIPFSQQLRALAPIAGTWAAGFVLVFALDMASGDGRLVVGDPTASPYAGFLTRLQILTWAIAFVSAVWSAWLARLGDRRGAARFLGTGAVVTSVMLLDDLLSVRNHLLRHDTPMRIGLIASLFGVICFWTLANLREIERTRGIVLACAQLSIVGSLLLDATAGGRSDDLNAVFRSMARFLGSLAWAVYFILTCADIGRSVYRQRTAPEGLSSGKGTGTGVRAAAGQGTAADASTAPDELVVVASLSGRLAELGQLQPLVAPHAEQT